MDKRLAAVILGVTSIIGVVALSIEGHDAVTQSGIIVAMVLQILNLVLTAHVETKVNGNLSALIAQKTLTPDPPPTPPETPTEVTRDGDGNPL